MNVAFPALLIFILVLPGVILRYTYARGAWRWASPTSTTGLADEIAYSVAFAIGLHLLWGLLTDLVSKLEVDPHSILVLLTGSYGPDSKYFEPTVASVATHPVAITSYLLSLYALAAGLGYGAHYLVRKYKLDRKTRILRFRNEWYYLLSGEVLEFKEYEEAQKASGASPINVEEDIDGVYLTAVVDLTTDSYIYRGVVSDFWFDKTGSLDRILLELADRRKLAADKEAALNEGEEEKEERRLLEVLAEADAKRAKFQHAYAEGAMTLEDLKIRTSEIDDACSLASSELAEVEARREHLHAVDGDADVVATPDARYYPIDGDFFLLRYSETKTINLDYFTLEG